MKVNEQRMRIKQIYKATGGDPNTSGVSASTMGLGNKGGFKTLDDQSLRAMTSNELSVMKHSRGEINSA